MNISTPQHQNSEYIIIVETGGLALLSFNAKNQCLLSFSHDTPTIHKLLT